ncbi:MAG: protease modulator HflC [bacterium]|nr:protease modulator HflC [bacterium]
MHKTAIVVAPAVAVVIVAVIVLSAAYVVAEGEQVMITRFGKPVGDVITNPGLNRKIPFIDEVHRLDKRILEWDGKLTEMATREKHFVLVECYARWRIADPLLFFQRLRNERGAQTRLDRIINGEVRDTVARHHLVELIRTFHREPIRGEVFFEDEAAELEPFAHGRAAIRRLILTGAQKRVTELGIEILDLQFKRIHYSSGPLQEVYRRMIAARRRIAARQRAVGELEAMRIRLELEPELERIRSQADRKAQEIIDQADAEAADIYAQAYNQSADARAFYDFVKTVEASNEKDR